MTNIYLSWSALKSRITATNKLYYHLGNWNWQLYTLEGTDAFIHYIPRPDRFSEMIIDSDNQAQAQSDYDDFNANYKPAGIETNGVKD